MIISYCTQCGKRNDIGIWPPTTTMNPIDACTCSNVMMKKMMSKEEAARVRVGHPDDGKKDDKAPYAEHYKGYPFEPVDIAESYGLDFNEGNVVKYLLRWRKKDGIKDLHKARYYIERLISLEERRLKEAGEQ